MTVQQLDAFIELGRQVYESRSRAEALGNASLSGLLDLAERFDSLDCRLLVHRCSADEWTFHQ